MEYQELAYYLYMEHQEQEQKKKEMRKRAYKPPKTRPLAVSNTVHGTLDPLLAQRIFDLASSCSQPTNRTKKSIKRYRLFIYAYLLHISS